MKACLQLLIVCIFFLSCSYSEDQVPTIINGEAKDLARNILSPGLKIYLHGWGPPSSTNLGGLAGYNYVLIDSTLTDESGQFELIFNYIPHYTHGLSFDPNIDKFGYYANVIDDSTSIEPEVLNIKNIDAWKPVILQLKLNILNNNNPDLAISNQTWPSYDYSFGSSIFIKDKEIDTIVYLPAKPNTDHRVVFNYKTGPHNEVYHNRYEFITTARQDTLRLNYVIDCLSF